MVLSSHSGVPPHCFGVVFITFENAQFFGPGRGSRPGGERETGERSNPRRPQPPPTPRTSQISRSPSLTPSTPLSTPQPPLVFLAPSEEGVRGREGEPAARLTWPSLRWGRRPRLPGRPQLRQDPRGPGPSGRALRSLSSSAPCGPGNSPGFWQRPRWHPDRPAGCLECRRPAWSRRSPGGWGGASLWGDRAEASRGWGRRRVLGD